MNGDLKSTPKSLITEQYQCNNKKILIKTEKVATSDISSPNSEAMGKTLEAASGNDKLLGGESCVETVWQGNDGQDRECETKSDSNETRKKRKRKVNPEEITTKKSKRVWSKYVKKYKHQWESDPMLGGWMEYHEDSGKVTCKFCNTTLRAHKTDLHKHSATRKHKRNCFGGSTYDKRDEEIVYTVSTNTSSPKKRLKSEKIVTEDGSYIILQGEQELFNHEESDLFMEYSDADPPLEEADLSDRTTTFIASRIKAQEISNIANRIGLVLVEDIEKILRSQKEVLKFFKDSGSSFSETTLSKMAKLCVAHLSQKYLAESVLESSMMMDTQSTSKERNHIIDTFEAIADKLERTVAEVKDLKMSIGDVSGTFPYATSDNVVDSTLVVNST